MHTHVCARVCRCMHACAEAWRGLCLSLPEHRRAARREGGSRCGPVGTRRGRVAPTVPRDPL